MITINFCNGCASKSFRTEDGGLYVENIITTLCKTLNISPSCQCIFGLKYLNNKIKTKSSYGLWLHSARKIVDLTVTSSYQFRIRFLPPSSKLLKKIDSVCYEYLFYQVRHDFINGSSPDFIQFPKDGLGLVVTDIVHHLIINSEKRIADLDISSFMPKYLRSIPNKYNVKSTTEAVLKSKESYTKKGSEYIRCQYLDKIEEIGRIGMHEKYCIELDEGNTSSNIDLFIDPFHITSPGLYYYAHKKVIQHICSIEELVFVSVRKQDLTVELSRENGVPVYFTLSNLEVLESFVGCLSGYYRLIRSWSFSLCTELPFPILIFLKCNKCHGPIGEEFSVEKLRSKYSNESGIGLIRMSSSTYDSYKVTVMQENAKISHYSIKKTDGQVHFEGCSEKFDGDKILSLVKWGIETNYSNWGLKRIIPPSDFDQCDKLLLYSAAKEQETANILSGPRVMHLDQFVPANKSPLRGKFSKVYHVRWYDDKAQELAVKVLQLSTKERESYLSKLNQILFIESNCIVKFFGITLEPLAVVMEYLSPGPLDLYLKKHSSRVRQVELVEACSYIAKALWDLNSKGFVHHNIRCHNVLVAEHTDQRFKVKLGDPGKFEYSWKDIHWIAREHVLHPSSALTDFQADVWAFATTMWEIFSYGESPLATTELEEVKAFYSQGSLLCKPERCPKDMYQVMLACWHPDPLCRKHPQAIMRDITQIFYYIFNSRRENPYQKLQLTYTNLNTVLPDDLCSGSDLDGSFKTMDLSDDVSVSTQTTALMQVDGTKTEMQYEQLKDFSTIMSPFIETSMSNDSTLSPKRRSKTQPMTLKDLLFSTRSLSRFDLVKAPPPIEMNDCSIDILKRIGKGNYGYVFQGRRKFKDQTSEIVALKRLQSVGNTTDFIQEMDIMKNLKHENIVQLFCLATSDQEGEEYQYMVMEYMPLGSLQDYIAANKEDLKLTSDKKLLDFSIDISKGMDYLESQQIIHRDLATRNVLVASEDHVKITDFGLAQKPNRGNYYILRTVREMPIKWYALESIEKGQFSHKSDVWSFGVTLWEMFTRGLTPDLPNEGTKLIQALKNGTRLTCKSPCKPFVYSKLIRPCWDEDPNMRPNFTKIMNVIIELQDEIW